MLKEEITAKQNLYDKLDKRLDAKEGEKGSISTGEAEGSSLEGTTIKGGIKLIRHIMNI